jgi:hypothetical protein
VPFPRTFSIALVIGFVIAPKIPPSPVFIPIAPNTDFDEPLPF